MRHQRDNYSTDTMRPSGLVECISANVAARAR